MFKLGKSVKSSWDPETGHLC